MFEESDPTATGLVEHMCLPLIAGFWMNCRRLKRGRVEESAIDSHRLSPIVEALQHWLLRNWGVGQGDVINRNRLIRGRVLRKVLHNVVNRHRIIGGGSKRCLQPPSPNEELWSIARAGGIKTTSRTPRCFIP